MKVRALAVAEVQDVRAALVPIATWTGLPIVPDRLDGDRLVRGEGSASLLKVESTMVDADGTLGERRCYTTSLRRFFIHPAEGEDPYRASENTVGVMVNPTPLRPQAFARECFCYLLAKESGESFEAEWLDEPVLWPQRLTHPDDLKRARAAIPDLKLGDSVVWVQRLFGGSLVARWVLGTPWRDLDWRTPESDRVDLVAAQQGALGRVRTWRRFLDSFLTHPVPFTRDSSGGRADRNTIGVLTPAPMLITGVDRTGRARWAELRGAETILPGEGEWDAVLEGLGTFSDRELEAAGLHPRTVRAMRAGRRPTKRNADAARRLVARKARAQAGLEQSNERCCVAPGCEETLTGRQRQFCKDHAGYSGTRRKKWKESR